MDWQFWLTVASCITADSFAHAFFIIQSVKIRCMYVFMNAWRRQWQPTPVLLPGKSYGRRSLVGYSPWGREESDTTEQLHFHFSLSLFTFLHWRRKWQPTPVYLPGESQGQELGGPLSMGSHRVGHDWRDLGGIGSPLPKSTWGHSCASRAHVPELEKPLWLVCIHCVPKADAPELGQPLVIL